MFNLQIMTKVLGFIKKIVNLAYQVKEEQLKKLLIHNIKYKQKRALKNIKEKSVIRAVFMAIDASVWKYDELFKLMVNNPRFEPIIFVCPMVNHGKEIMIEKINQSVSFYKEKGYNVVCSYDNGRYVDLRRDLRPDILFYTNPYRGLIDERYYIVNYKDILSVYVSYYYTSSIDVDFNTNIFLYNLVWRKYVENNYTKEERE